MDFGDNPAEAGYRQRLREWLGQVLPELGDRSDKRASLYRSAATRKWQHLLYDAAIPSLVARAKSAARASDRRSTSS